MVRERDKRCQRCFKDYGLQCAHVFSRSKKSVRWDFENAVTLCGGCHLFWAHKYPLDFYEWIEGRMGKEAFNKLRLRSNLAVSLSVIDLKFTLMGLNR